MDQRTQAASPEHDRVLGFETPVADWSTSNGSPRSASTTVSQGAASLSVTPNGYTEVVSIPVAAPGAARSTATVDLRLPQSLGWGDVRLVVRVPSQGHWWRDLGGQPLAGRAPGVFHTFSFSVPEDLRAALNSSATDVDYRVILNVPGGSGSYLLDNLVVSDAVPSGGGTTTPTSQVEFSLAVPRGLAVADVMISGTNQVTIDDRSDLSKAGTLTHVTNLGSSTMEFGAQIDAYANVTSVGNVNFLRSQSHTYGSVTTAGTVTRQDGSVLIDGAVTEHASVVPVETRWTVDWPVGVTNDISRAPDAPNLAIAPGAYDSIQIFSRATVTFRSGAYFINSLVAEPEAKLRVDASGGPVLFYVRDTLRLNVGLEYIGGERGQVLFAYLGNQSAYFEEAIVASVVAPNSVIDLRRPASGKPHEGSFFGKHVHVLSDATVLHLPLDWSFICELGDFDKDGVLDCFDECRMNANKSEKGVCGCLEPETNTDGDAVPDCEDACPLDATATFAGTCGCPSNPAPSGTPCNDGICGGNSLTCDGAGTCGDLSCRPDPSCRAFYVSSTDKFYWVCDRAVSWQQAATICDGPAGTKLATVSQSQINELVAQNATANVWIGANSLDASGEWHWRTYTANSGTKFWTGGAGGKPVFSRYSAFGGAPSGEGRCAYASTSGQWSAANCGDTHGFVCEVSNDRLGGGPGIGGPWGPYEPKGAGEITGTPPYQEPGPDCVDPEDFLEEFDSEGKVLALFADCESCLEDQQSDSSVDCSTRCVGPATVPDPDDTCTISGDEFRVSTISCATGSLEVAEDSGGNPIACSESADCEAPSSGRCATDSDCSGDYDRCVADSGRCVQVLVCDIKAGHCVVPASNCSGVTHPEACSEVEFCEAPPTQTTTTIEAGSADLQPIPSVGKTFFGEEPELEELPPLEDEPCQNCGNIEGNAHPWCRFGATDGDALTPRTTSPPSAGKNDGDKIEFNFEPVFEFTQNAALGPIGLPDIHLRAAAGLSASVKVNFAGNPQFDIINALGELDTTHCGVHADVTLEIFGKDVIADYKEGRLPFDLPADDCEGPDCGPTPQEQCEQVYSDFSNAVDRAKKAMRDAAELMRQYEKAVEEGRRLPPDLCRIIAAPGTTPRGFPDGFCPESGTTETPEQTINRFIQYYRGMIIGFGNKKFTEGALSLTDYAQRLAAYVPNPGAERELAKFNEAKEQKIIAAQFFIGPIPAFLEVGSTVDFGVLVNARAGLRVGDFVNQILDFSSTEANSTEVAYAGVSGAPYAGAGLYLFAGVGFGIPGFSVQIGVQGDVHIGTIYIPAYAGAGLWIGSDMDDRGVPDSLEDFSTGAYLIPPKVYSAQLGYTVGLEARVRDVLSGTIAGKIKLEILFFSKTWKATILKFDGICSWNSADANGNVAGCDFPIFQADGEIVAAEGEFGWGFITMPTTFPMLRLPSRSEILAAAGLPEIPAADIPSLPVQTFDSSRVNELFYDSQCEECSGTGLAERPEDDCFSSTDCCEENPVCYKHTFGADIGRSECRECARGLQANECYQDSHCCDSTPFCAGGRCTDGECSTCFFADDCKEGFSCVPSSVGSSTWQCIPRYDNGDINYSYCIIVT